MLKLKKLIICNIGRFVEEQTIDFDSLGNIVQVDAENRLTGGSSGSGKSTIFNALDWLLGFSSLSLGVLQSRLTKDAAFAEGHFEWDDKKVIIKRAKKLSITIDGIETTGSSKLTEELLDQILGVPRDLFRPLLHKKQGEHGFFLQFTPSQMNNFLTDSLGLSTVRSKIDIIDEKTKDLASIKIDKSSSLEAAKAALKATQEALQSLGAEPTTDASEILLEGWKGQYDASKAILVEVQSRHRQEKDALEQKKPKLISFTLDRAHLSALEAENKTINDKIIGIMNVEKDRQSTVNREISNYKIEINTRQNALKLENSKENSTIKSEIAKLTNQVQLGKASKEEAIKIAGRIKTLRSGVCHTCEQSWVTDNAKNEEQILLQEISKHRTNIELSSQAETQISTLKCTLDVTNERYNAQLALLEQESNNQLVVLAEKSRSQTSLEIHSLNTEISRISKLHAEERAKEDLHTTNQNLENRKAMENFFVEQKALAAKHEAELSEINKTINENRSQYESVRGSLIAHKEALMRYGSSSNASRTQEWELNQKVDQMNQELVQTNERLELMEEAKRCLKSYLSCSFDDALESISDSATRILRSIPTMANSTIRLEGTRETDKGAIKEQVTAEIDNDGEISVPIKSLSGGERSAVDLAVDFAVCEMLQERNNVGIDTMILDEPFNGFDSVGIEHALEMLKTFAVNKRVLIVEHDSVAKEFINDRITVIRENETSFIK